MKKLNFKILAIVSMALVIGFTIYSFTLPGNNGTAKTKEKKDTIHLKIIKEVNGKLTEIDTIIYADPQFDADALLKLKDKEIDLTINMDSIMTIVNQSLKNLPNMDSMMTIVCKSIHGLPDMDSLETVIHQSMKDLPDMDSIIAMVETNIKDCPKSIRIIKSDSLSPNCCLYIDDKNIKNQPKGTKIIKDENKTIIIKCDDRNGNFTWKELDGKKCCNSNTIVCKVIIQDPSEQDKNIIKESYSKDGNLKVENIEFFPNPGTGKFNLSFTTAMKGKTEVKITDTKGIEVYKETITDFKGNYSKEIDISQNPKGIYFLTIMQGKKTMTKKLIIQ